MTRDDLVGAFEVYRFSGGRAVHFCVRGRPERNYFLYVESDGNVILERTRRHKRNDGMTQWLRLPQRMVPYVVLALWPQWSPPDFYDPRRFVK